MTGIFYRPFSPAAAGRPDNLEARGEIERDYAAARTQADLDNIKAMVQDADARGLLSDADKAAVRGYAAAASKRVKAAPPQPQPAAGHGDPGDTDDIPY